MGNKKLDLSELQVKSFTTSPNHVKGGRETLVCTQNPFVCPTYYDPGCSNLLECPN
jgi:hypothetical protein